jgi:hypothetical protein
VGSHESVTTCDATAVLAAATQLFMLHRLALRPAASLADLAHRTLTDPSSVSTDVDRRVRRDPVGRLPQQAIANHVCALPAERRATVIRALAPLVPTAGADELPVRMLLEDEPDAHPQPQ